MPDLTDPILSDRDREPFVQARDIIQDHGSTKTLGKDDLVSFDLTQSEKGPRARNVRVIDRANSNPTFHHLHD